MPSAARATGPIDTLAGEAGDKQQRQSLALGRYLEESEAHEQWAQAADLSRESAAWLLARPVEPLNAIYDLPARPLDRLARMTQFEVIDAKFVSHSAGGFDLSMWLK